MISKLLVELGYNFAENQFLHVYTMVSSKRLDAMNFRKWKLFPNSPSIRYDVISKNIEDF